MKKLGISLLLSIGFFSSFSWAQGVDHGRASEFRAEGQLLSIRIVPKDRSAKLYIAGNKMAEANLKEAKIVSITLLNKDKREILQFDQQGDAYHVQNLPSHQPYQLFIKAEVRGQIDEMQVKVPVTKP